MSRDKQNPYDTRNIIPTKRTKLGDGYTKYTADSAPDSAGDGTPVDEWTGVHVTFYADAASYDGMYIRVIPWRWYGQSEQGMSAAVPIGRWVADQMIEVALDPAMITGARGAHYVWDTRDCESMFWQIEGYYDADGFTALRPDWLVIQPYGLLIDTVVSAASGVSGGGGSGDAEATHGAAVIATGPQVMDEAKDYDGGVLPNAVAEGDAVRAAASLRGIRYVMLTAKDGVGTPQVAHDAVINAANGGTQGLMAMAEAKAFDLATLPNPVAEGDAARTATTLAGIPYAFLTNATGSATPIAKEGATLLNTDGDTHGMSVMGRGVNVLPAAVDHLDGVSIATDLRGRTMLSSNQLASESDRNEEINPLDTRDTPDILADGVSVAALATVDFYVPLSHMKGFSIHWEPNDAHFTLKVYATDEDNGTALAACNYIDVTNDWFGAATFTADAFLLFDTEMCAYAIHIEVVRADEGAATHELFVRRNF